jgi:hypothetical protein
MVLTKKKRRKNPHGRRENISIPNQKNGMDPLPIVGSRTPACQAQLLHLTDCGLACPSLLFRLVWAVFFGAEPLCSQLIWMPKQVHNLNSENLF